MDEAPSAATEEPTPMSSGTLPWFVACLVSTTALSLIAAHVPGRVRLIGLFSIAFGLLVGLIVAQLAEMLKPRHTRRYVAAFAAILTLVGLIGSTYEVNRLDALKRTPSSNELLALQMAKQMKEQTAPSSEGQPNSFNSLSEELDTSFRRHLARRVRQLGDWKSPWPELFWTAELITSAAASFWIVSRGRASTPRPT